MMHETASAASFMPFKKVINNANANEATMMKTNISRFLNNNCSDGICNILQHIAGIFESLGDILVLDQLYIFVIVVKQIADIIEINAVNYMLDMLYLVTVVDYFIVV